jgi:urease accessory protein
MKPVTRWTLCASLFFASVALAHAHPGHDGHDLIWDFQAGFTHPFTGWDHLLAMFAVGWWATQLTGRARWAVPVSFLTALSVGTLFGRIGASVPGVEQAIAASVLAFGLLLAARGRIPVAIASVLAGAFAVFHGLAHGAEARANVHAGLAVLGFVVGTACLLGAGFAFGSLIAKRRPLLSTLAGSAVAICGFVLLAA